jgi:hypothetical protein
LPHPAEGHATVQQGLHNLLRPSVAVDSGRDDVARRDCPSDTADWSALFLTSKGGNHAGTSPSSTINVSRDLELPTLD